MKLIYMLKNLQRSIMLFLEAELDANFDLKKAFDLNGRPFT